MLSYILPTNDIFNNIIDGKQLQFDLTTTASVLIFFYGNFQFFFVNYNH